MRTIIFEVNTTEAPHTCFPVDLDTGELVNITPVGSVWGRFLDPATGTIHDCAEYYEAAIDARN